MKIALVTPNKVYFGGVETVNSILIGIFTEEGHQVDLITTDGFKHTLFTRLMTKLIGLPYITANRFKKIEENYDVIIANGEFGWGVNHPKTINLFHGCYKGYRDYLKNILTLKQYLGLTKSAFIQKLSSKDKYVVTVSKFIKNILEEDNIEVSQVISNCVDLALFKPNKDLTREKYIFVGSYNYYGKGFDVLEDLSKFGYEIDCVTNQKPEKNLTWIQNTNNSQMPVVYNQHRILIFPSRFEGVGLVPLEAMACGLPIVMSNVGLGVELREVIPEFVVDDHNSKEYQEKLEHIENNYELFSKKARNYVEKYHSYEKYKEQWLELIGKVAND